MCVCIGVAGWEGGLMLDDKFVYVNIVCFDVVVFKVNLMLH